MSKYTIECGGAFLSIEPSEDGKHVWMIIRRDGSERSINLPCEDMDMLLNMLQRAGNAAYTTQMQTEHLMPMMDVGLGQRLGEAFAKGSTAKRGVGNCFGGGIGRIEQPDE